MNRGWTQTLLGLSYPLVVHICVMAERVSLAIYWLAALLVIFAIGMSLHRERSGIAAALLAIVALGIAWTAAAGHRLVVFLPPAAINLVLFLTFARSLLPGDTPLITRLASLMDPHLSERALRYTRGVTGVWAAYFALMTLLVSGFALFAPIEVWSYVANCLHYLLVPALFVGEFLVRRRVLRDEAGDGFGSFLKRLIATVT